MRVGDSVERLRRVQGPIERLAARETEVLSLMAEGRSNAAIACDLVLTTGAVEKHVASILGKLQLPPSGNDHRRGSPCSPTCAATTRGTAPAEAPSREVEVS